MLPLVIGQGLGDALDHPYQLLEVVSLVLDRAFALGEQPRPLYQGVIGVRFEPFP
jgi:hypothetical protein